MSPAPVFNVAEWLEQSRAALEATLTDTVAVTRETVGEPDELGTDTVTAVPVWSGPGLVQYVATSSDATHPRRAAGQTVEAGSYTIKLPSSVPVQPGDIATCTASNDSRLAGRAWRVLVVPFQGWCVLRRCLADPIETETETGTEEVGA